MDKWIYLDRQFFPSMLKNISTLEVALKGLSSTKSSLVNQFENSLAFFLKTSQDKLIATNSGTSALFLALMGIMNKSLNITTDNTEIIIPATTFIATANIVKYHGFNLKICDINPNTWCMDHEKLDEIVDNCDKPNLIIIYVDLFGNISNIWTYESKFGNKSHILVDACHSFGTIPSSYRKSIIDYLCYSFNGNKTITTGAGGLILCGDMNKIEDIEYVKNISMVGQNINNHEFRNIGYNYRMAGINASLGLIQLKIISDIIKKKKKFNEIYREELKDFLEFQYVSSYDHNITWWLTAALFPLGINVNNIQKRLLNKGIETGRIFKPLNYHKPYQYIKDKFFIAEDIYNRGLCLPSSICNSIDDIYFVCKEIKRILRG